MRATQVLLVLTSKGEQMFRWIGIRILESAKANTFRFLITLFGLVF